MDPIAGLTPTGRKLIGPASDLVELKAENGLRNTAIVFHPEYRSHPGITDALQVARGFLESPLVTGLVELTGHDPETGTFVYPTGSVWSVAEMVRILSDIGEPAGTRAGLELMYTAGQIIVEGADAGSAAGVYSHGGLTPRRVMVKQDGQVMVIGHALPQVEILAFQAGGGTLPREDSFRYCPPERMEGHPEDVSSDLFGLALIGFELMTGKPVYDGLVNDIRQQASRGEGSRRLFRFREVVDEGVRDALAQALRPGLGSRFGDGDDFLDAIHGLLSKRKVEGPSLIELMDTVTGAQPRQGQKLEVSSTVMVDKDVLARGLESSNASAQGRAPEQSWSPGRRRSVRRKAGGLEQVLGASRTSDPQDRSPPGSASAEPTVVEASLEGSLEVSTLGSSPEPVVGSHRWSKVQRAPSRRRAVSAPGGRVEPSAPPNAPPPPVVPDASINRVKESGSSAAALLARIRGDGAEVPEPPAALKPRPAPAPPPVPEPIDPAALAPTRTDDASTVMMSREQLRATVASALEQDEPLLVLDTTQAALGEALVPSRSLDSVGTGGLVPSQILLPGRKKPDSVFLPPGCTSAAAVGWIVGSAVPLPVDMSGRMSGWYRLQISGEPVAPQARVSGLGPGLCLVFVPALSASAQIELHQGASTVRFMSPVGMAVPVSSLVAHLMVWLGLDPGPWRLFRDGVVLGDHAILADTGPPEGLTLTLKQEGE
jgi:hypothetical protein